MPSQQARLAFAAAGYLASVAYASSAPAEAGSVHDYAFVGCGNPWTTLTDFRRVKELKAEPVVPELCGAVCDDELYLATFEGACYCAEELTVDVDTKSSKCAENVPSIYKDESANRASSKTVQKRQSTNKNTINFGDLGQGSTNKNTISFSNNKDSGDSTNKNTLQFPGKGGSSTNTDNVGTPSTGVQFAGGDEPDTATSDPEGGAPSNSGPEDSNTPGVNETPEPEPQPNNENTPVTSLNDTDEPSENPDNGTSPPSSDPATDEPGDSTTPATNEPGDSITPDDNEPEQVVNSPPDSESSDNNTPDNDNGNTTSDNDDTPDDGGTFTTTSEPEPVDDSNTPEDGAPDSNSSNNDETDGGTPDDQFTTLSEPDPQPEPPAADENTPDGAEGGSGPAPEDQLTTTSQPEPANDPAAPEDGNVTGGPNDSAEPEVQYITTSDSDPANDPSTSGDNVPDSGSPGTNDPSVLEDSPETGDENGPFVPENGDTVTVVPAGDGSDDASQVGNPENGEAVLPGSGEPASLYETSEGGEPRPVAPAAPDAAAQGAVQDQGAVTECGCPLANSTAPSGPAPEEPVPEAPPAAPPAAPVTTLVPQPPPPPPAASPEPVPNPGQPDQVALGSSSFQPFSVAMVVVGLTCVHFLL